MPSWRQEIDRWQREDERARGEDPDMDDHRNEEALREWLEDAAVIAARELQNGVLVGIYGLALQALAVRHEGGRPGWYYFSASGDLNLRLATAERRGDVEVWELEYVNGKLGARPWI